jgi:hypothetical protein
MAASFARLSRGGIEADYLRLALGSTAYEDIVRDLSKRVAAIEAQREVAFPAEHAEE